MTYSSTMYSSTMYLTGIATLFVVFIAACIIALCISIGVIIDGSMPFVIRAIVSLIVIGFSGAVLVILGGTKC